jgi:chromosome segregation ATPase
MAYEQVAARFSAAEGYANTATNQATSFITALNATMAGLQLPQFNYDLTWPDAPTILRPDTPNVVLPAVTFPVDDTGLAPAAPDVSFDVALAPTEPVLGAYTFTPGVIGDTPAAPDLTTTLTLQTDPGDWQPPPAPVLLTISSRVFGGVSTFSGMANQLQALPGDLVLDAPAAYEPPTEAQYSSNFLTALRDELRRRIAGGTGISAAVEAQIWARAQSREAGLVEANIAEVTKNAEARGFSLPSGAFAAQLREAQKTALGKYSEQSTDIAIKQAELEQANVKHAIEQGNAMEGQLISYSNSMMNRAFDAAKYLAENAVAVYNAQVTLFRTNLEKYGAYAAAYRALIDGERAKVEVYAAEVNAERTKVEMNRSLVEQQRVQIELRKSEIELYKERLAAAQVVLSLDNLKLQAFGERVKAYAASISAEATRVEMFNTQLKTNQTITDTYKTSVEAYATKLRATSDAAKVKAETYDSTVRAFASRVGAYATRVDTAAKQIDSAVRVEGLKLDVAKLDSTNVAAINQTEIEHYRAEISLYESNKSIAMAQAKLISDNYFALRALVADASKVAAQVNAQLAASAFGSIQANASIQGNSSTQVGYSYQGQVASAVPPLTSI